MSLQNRVDPFGVIHAVAERGGLMGNRGIIHDPARRTLLKRRWAAKSWIICLCDFKGRKRKVMAPGTYTELFFLDEATALAAGHRPCFECRRGRARSFADAFAAGRKRDRMSAAEIDAVLHTERAAAGNPLPVLDAGAIESLPEASMIAIDGRAFMIAEGQALPWSFGGYGAPVPYKEIVCDAVALLTPASTIAALRAGYRPTTAHRNAA